MPKSARPDLAPLALMVALAAPLAAQAPAPREAPVFGTGVSLLAVPVFVTDKAGRAVPGLTAADFEIEDQGRKVPLVAFQAIDASSPAPAAEAGSLIQAAARRQFLLLFDLTFSTPAGIMRARDAALSLVRESLAPSDLAAAATFSQRGVQVLVGFTPDRAQLERAITTLGLVETQPPARDTLSIAYDLGVGRWGPGLGPPPDDQMSQHLIEMSRLMARGDQAYYRERAFGFLDGLDQLVRTLDVVRGRKQVILLSAGFDSTVTGGARGQESSEASEAVTSGRLWEVQSDRYFGDSTARDALDKLFRAVAATDTVLHTVDVSGLAAGAAVDQALPQPLARGRDTLAQLAANTGGRFVGDTNDLHGALVEVLETSRHYYVLGFEPVDPKSRPERPRRLKIRVRGDGLSVSYRRGYVLADPKRDTSPASATLEAAEAIVKGLSGGPIGLRALGVPYRNATGRLSLPVILQIDGRTLTSGGASQQLALEVFGYAFDAQGRLQDTLTLAPTLDLAAVRPALEGKGLQVLTSFAVPAGAVDLRFVVREKASRRMGSLRLRLDVPDFAGQQAVLSPPLAMDDPRARLIVPAPSRALPALEIPFRFGQRAFTAEPFPTLRNGATQEVCVMAWGGPSGEPYEVEAELVDASGATRELPLAGAPRMAADSDGTARYVVTLAPDGVPPGRYVLRLAFLDPAADGEARSEIAIRVE